MDKEKALQRYIKSQQALQAALASIPEGQKKSLMVEGTWTVKELLCHFIGWDKALLDPLCIFVATGDLPVRLVEDHDQYNAEQTSMREEWPLEKVLVESSQTSQQLFEMVSQLTSEQCQAVFPAPWGGESTIPGMLAGLAWHVDEHLKDLNTEIHNN